MSILGSIQSVGRPDGPKKISLPGVLVHWEVPQIETRDHGIIIVVCENRDIFWRFVNFFDMNKVRHLDARLLIMGDGTEYRMAIANDMQHIMGYHPDKVIVYNTILTMQQWDLIRSRMVKPGAQVVTILD